MPSEHSKFFSPSSGARLLTCPGSAKASEGIPEQISLFANEGTDAHELAEIRLKESHGFKPDGKVEDLTWYSAEMEEYIQGYVNYVNEKYQEAKKSCSDPVLLIEQKVSAERYHESLYGTTDVSLIADKVLTIIDLKYGKGVKVDAKQNVKVQNGDKESSFKLEAYLLPRVDEFSSPIAKKEARVSNDMEGFYVYRENRLIYFGSWLDMFVNDPHISLLRVNFSFDHTLDELFNVDIKKSRIILNEDIYEYIKETFMPAPRREAENLYRKGQTAQIKKNSAGAHDASNNNIDSKASSVEQSKVEVIDPTTDKVKISNSQGSFTGTIKILPITQPGQCRVIPVNSIESNMLWEPTIVDGKHAVSINQAHEYYSKVYAPVLDNHVLVTGMDALLWALSEAELSTYNEETKEQYYDMRVQVSRIIKKLVNDLPDPDTNSDDN